MTSQKTSLRTIRIGIDGNDANVEKKVGVSVCLYELLNYFSTHIPEGVSFVIYLRRPPRKDLPAESEHFHYVVVRGPVLWSKLFLPIHLYTHTRPTVFFSPAHYTPSLCPCPIVVTIHDLAYKYFPHEFLQKDLYTLNSWTKDSVYKSQGIIAVSQSTKNDIITWYHQQPDKITVIHNGFKKILAARDPSHPSQGKNYFLYVGTLQPRKNISGLIDAFAIISDEFPNLELIIIGKKGWMYEQFEKKVADLELQKKVSFLGYVADKQLGLWYKHAIAYVLPSLYEGFGLPILEAMSIGCPVITSHNSSLPEIGADACLYIDPSKPKDLASAMVQLLQDKKLRTQLIAKGYENCKRFSWMQAGKKTLNTLVHYSL